MFDLVVGPHGDMPNVRLAFVEREFLLKIGRTSPPSDLLLPSTFVSRAHCALDENDERCMIVDLGSTSGTYVNDRKIAKPTELQPGDRITIGGVSMSFVRVIAPPFAFADATEAQLAAAIAARDDASFVVYADWLEQRGDHARISYLRALHALAGWDFDQRARLGELARAVDPAWRLALAR
jgi:uncharacterized protein (TIGR02996 family)